MAHPRPVSEFEFVGYARSVMRSFVNKKYLLGIAMCVNGFGNLIAVFV